MARRHFVVIVLFIVVVIRFGVWLKVIGYQEHILLWTVAIVTAIDALPSVPPKDAGVLLAPTEIFTSFCAHI